jgi:hypothetical protein
MRPTIAFRRTLSFWVISTMLDEVRIRATPDKAPCSVWILGSAFMARNSRRLLRPLPHVRSPHFAPEMLEDAINIYRTSPLRHSGLQDPIS